MQDILSQKPSCPPVRSGKRAESPPEGAAAAFTSARNLWKSAQTAADEDDSVVIIEGAEEPEAKPLKSRKPKEAAAAAVPGLPTDGSKTDDEPWKKYMPSPKKTKAKKVNDREKNAAATIEQQPEPKNKMANRTAKKTDTMSKHFSRVSEPQATEQSEIAPYEPLDLERAPDRRLDWTPPSSKQMRAPNASSSAVENLTNATFKTLLESYSCKEGPQRDTATKLVSDEDSSFVKKRKLLALASPAKGSRSVSPEKSPTKQKAPRKKPRTITELATAAYRPVLSEGEMAPPPGSLLDYFPNGPAESKDTEDQTAGKPKAKGRKKTAKPKASKKKAALSKPILLSPTTALTEHSKQDFVFGTSSQLVRETSPTMLRDLQVAMKQSTQVPPDAFLDADTSDALELDEPKLKLWEAGSRDDDGRLFHATVINLVDSSPGSLPTDHEGDVSGSRSPDEAPEVRSSVSGAEGHSFEALSDSPLPPIRQPWREDPPVQRTSGKMAQLGGRTTVALTADESFPDLSDILKPAANDVAMDPPTIIDDDCPFSSSQVSVSSTVTGRANAPFTSPPKTVQTQVTTQPPEVASSSVTSRGDPKEPNFELYTDAQLSTEIATYGFKAIKKRPAMISLLQQCWESKYQTAPTGARTIATSSRDKAQPGASPKRPRGRPRKDDVGISENQEPPPSGQGAESPKRSRGRPRKDATSSRAPVTMPVSEPPPSAQDAASPKRPRGRPRKGSASLTRARSPANKTKTTTKVSRTSASKPLQVTPQKFKASQAPIEIPDSASDDNRSVMSRSPTLSPEPTFSPSQKEVDLSVSMEEEDEAEQSLLLNPDEEEAGLFKRIASAVTGAPRTTDPQNPSWYEKILMYDPIVLEDLTAWLNSGQLTRVGYDGEVKPADVKKWCESESICCLWRVNLRGKERKRL